MSKRVVVTALAVAAAALVAPAVAQTFSAGEPSVAAAAGLALTSAQRITVYNTIMRAPQAGAAIDAPRLGAPVPPMVRLYQVPPAAAVEVPAVKTLRYFVVQDRVLLVDPGTSIVVGEVLPWRPARPTSSG